MMSSFKLSRSSFFRARQNWQQGHFDLSVGGEKFGSQKYIPNAEDR